MVEELLEQVSTLYEDDDLQLDEPLEELLADSRGKRSVCRIAMISLELA